MIDQIKLSEKDIQKNESTYQQHKWKWEKLMLPVQSLIHMLLFPARKIGLKDKIK
jgi:hypothetical protein